MTTPIFLDPSKRLLYQTVVIPAGTPLAAPFDLRSYTLKGFIIPDSWTAANLSFRAGISLDPSVLRDVVDDAGAEVVVTAASGRYVVLGVQVEKLVGVNNVQLRSGTSTVPVNQAASREVVLVLGASTK